jgi:hypothetical protein
MQDYVTFDEYARAVETRDAQIAALAYSVEALCADLVIAKTTIREQLDVIRALVS